MIKFQPRFVSARKKTLCTHVFGPVIMHAGEGAGDAARTADNATTRRNWTAGQSSVFDSSGSSSNEEQGKPRGLRGVQVLDPLTPDTDIRSSGSTIRGGGSAAGGDGGAGGGGGRASDSAAGSGSRDPGGGVPVVRLHAGLRSTGGPAAASGDRPNTSYVPRLDTLKGMPGINQGASGDTSGSEYYFLQTRK